MLLHRSGELYSVMFAPLTISDLSNMRKRDGWQFDWSIPWNKPNIEVYKMFVKGAERIEGVIALEPIPEDLYVYVHLIESAPHNIGENREFYYVGPHLFAFACNRSISLGFDGFVAFTAKTELIDHYKTSLGAQLINNRGRMIINEFAARELIRLYL